ALEPRTHRLRESFLGGEALRQRPGDGVGARGGLGALGRGEDSGEEPVAPAIERVLDPLDVAQVRADADDHAVVPRALSISSRMWRTLKSRPVKIASPIRKWPMLSSASCGMAATGTTLSNVRPWPACASMPFLTAS